MGRPTANYELGSFLTMLERFYPFDHPQPSYRAFKTMMEEHPMKQRGNLVHGLAEALVPETDLRGIVLTWLETRLPYVCLRSLLLLAHKQISDFEVLMAFSPADPCTLITCAGTAKGGTVRLPL